MLRSLIFCKTDTIDMILIAVDPAYQSKGVPAMLIADLFDRIAAPDSNILRPILNLRTISQSRTSGAVSIPASIAVAAFTEKISRPIRANSKTGILAPPLKFSYFYRNFY